MAKLSERIIVGGKLDLNPVWVEQHRVLEQSAFKNIGIKTGDTQMTTLRTINLTLVDNNPNLKAKDKIVFQTLNFITEHNDERTIQQVLMSGDVATALDKHNKKRLETVDKEILRNTGRDVMLEEVEIFDLQWQVVCVA